MTLSLVIGGARSGKSARAERLAHRSGLPVHYIATADATDPEMAARIAAHAARRPATWTTTVARDNLAGVVAARPGECALVDGLGTWVAGVMHRRGAFDASERLDEVADHVVAQLEAITWMAAERPVIVVAEEAGQGVLPADAASRAWVDIVGEGTQLLSGAATRAELVVAGRALALEAATVGDDGAAAPVAAGGGGDGCAEDLRHHGDRDVARGLRDHAVNVLAGGPPAWLREPLARALADDAQRYPDDRAAVAALAALHGRDPAEVVTANGAAEALWLLGPALRPTLAACVHPGFTESEAALRAHGIPVARVLRDPAAGFVLDAGAVPAEADLVIVGNPASPSGTLQDASAVLALRRPGRTLVVDEAFMGMVPGEPGSLVAQPLDGVIVVRSLTKLLSIPGLRVGYALARPPLAARLRAARPPWSANAIALAALSAAAERPAELSEAAERARREGADLAARLTDLAARLSDPAGLRTWPSATNFCLVEVPDGSGVHRALRAEGLAVRHATSFPGLGEGHLRLTARDPDANAGLVAALERALT